jgi:outer membrane lipoprotein-sorting protein
MKKRQMMLLLLLMLTCFSLVLVGCGQKNDDDMFEDTVGGLANEDSEVDLTVGSDDASYAYNADIPSGYPYDLCPIYEPSKVNIAMESEDQDFISYTVNLLTVDEIKKVKTFYSTLNPQSSNDMGTMAVYIFESENGVDYASVTVMANQDEADQEFETSITISVGLGK